MKKINIILILLLITTVCMASEFTYDDWKPTKGGDIYEKYILKYYPLAVEQMEKYDIPASITLAQGLLESAAGNSKLVRKSNNHFGIKADKSWNGANSSSGGHKYRSYDSARESYEDHSKFLTSRGRYDFLFKLKRTNYKDWAKGLKKAGYAEDPAYPQKLISLIERYELYKFDTYSGYKKLGATLSETCKHTIYRANGLLYIIADSGDTFKSLAKELGVSRRKLIRYNDLYKDYVIKQGDIIYLEKKNSKAQKQHEFHTTKQNESLYSISQIYGIRLKKLLNMNPQFKEYAKLKVGDIIRLR